MSLVSIVVLRTESESSYSPSLIRICFAWVVVLPPKKSIHSTRYPPTQRRKTPLDSQCSVARLSLSEYKNVRTRVFGKEHQHAGSKVWIRSPHQWVLCCAINRFEKEQQNHCSRTTKKELGSATDSMLHCLRPSSLEDINRDECNNNCGNLRL